MTIRIQHLDLNHDDSNYIKGEGQSVIYDDAERFNLLSTVRHIMRERSDCSKIPTVLEAMRVPTNRWGHDLIVEVSYSRTMAYRAVYGVTTGPDGVTEVACYMD